MVDERDNHVGTIEHTRKMLAFLKTLTAPTPTARALIREYEAEIAGYEYGQRETPNDFHDVAGARV